MDRRLFGLATAIAVAVFATACDQAPPSAPQDGPAFKPAPTAAFPCAFTGNPSLGNAINSYFTVTAEKKQANDFATVMQEDFTGTDPYAGARDAGYDLLSFLGEVSRRGTGASPEAGASVAQQAIQCMYNVSAARNHGDDFEGWPTDNQFDFASSLRPTFGGAWYVRGKEGTDAEAPAIGNIASLNTTSDFAGNLSAINPPIFPAAYSWSQVLKNTRTLVYGEPVYNGLTTTGYDWKLIPRSIKFTPHAVVALCQGLHPDQLFPDAALVHQQFVGFLGAPYIGNLCTTDPPMAMLDAQWGRFAFIGKLASAADRLFAPQELAASVAVATSGTGGSVCCAKSSEFTSEEVPTVQLDVLPPNVPHSIKVSTDRFSLTIKVSTPDAAAEPVGGVKVSLSIVNNSGPTHIYEITSAGKEAGYLGCNPADNPAYVVPAEETTLGVVSSDGTAAPTIASWVDNLCIDKTGTATIVATSVSDGNPNAAQATITAAMTTVKGQ
jgi:hypothetical protein